MKKALSLILALILCLSLCACGGGSSASQNGTSSTDDSQTKGTPMTIDNYATYLNVSVSSHATNDDTHPMMSVQKHNNGSGMKVPGGSTYYLYPLLYINTSVKPASTNFNYYDVELTVKVSGTYNPGNPSTGTWGNSTTFEEEITVNCNIGGTAFDNQYIDLGCYLHSDMMEYKWEVVSISGYVDAAG